MVKKNIDVLKYRFIAIGASILLIFSGLIVFIALGFNTGIDFGSGYSETVQVAPTGFKASYTGDKSLILSVSSNTLVLTIRDSEGVSTMRFRPSDYPNSDDIVSELENYGVDAVSVNNLPSANLVSGFGFPATLSETPVSVNFATDTADIKIEDIREALEDLGNVSVQTVGKKSDGIYQIRIPVSDDATQSSVESMLNTALSNHFGSDNIVVMQSDFVGPKFSSSLFKSSVTGIIVALALILIYISLRFRVAYALSSIIALMHDVLAMLSFILIFRLEVSSTTIAAVLTIIGYSLNNTVVIFDRVRENINGDRTADVDWQITRSVSQTLSRTIITSLTTLFAIVPLAVFGSGNIKLFAINLTWGIIAGGYSSLFIAPSLLHFLHKLFPINKEKKREDSDYLFV